MELKSERIKIILIWMFGFQSILNLTKIYYQFEAYIQVVRDYFIY